ncbi:hypothetical protein HN709_04685 [Candidatus Peregrinibacteria bacterium]|nr:hypothetical protein [Candidatus Peregrinibacteria bacterium]MBT7736959.1 hypothetical protein [Candidatus Peregrinibacteria bacterium]
MTRKPSDGIQVDRETMDRILSGDARALDQIVAQAAELMGGDISQFIAQGPEFVGGDPRQMAAQVREFLGRDLVGMELIAELGDVLGGGMAAQMLFPEAARTADRACDVCRVATDETPRHTEYLEEMEMRLNGLVEVHPFTPEMDGRVDQRLARFQEVFEKIVEPLDASIARHFFRKGPRADEAMEMSSRLAELAAGGGEMTALLQTLEVLDAFDDSQDLQLNDICGAEGISAFAAAIIRNDGRKKTFGSCYEQNSREEAFFKLLKNHLALGRSHFFFNKGDVRRQKFHRRAGARNIWLMKYPADMTGHLTERVAHLSPKEVPEGIGLIPCGCHSYNAEARPNLDSMVLTPEEWDKLSLMNDLEDASHCINSPVSQNAQRARMLLNIARAHSMNGANPHLQAEVHELKGNKGHSIVTAKPRK